jgi:regulatory protein YycI of two-component signal transduction system YycFG
MRIFIITFLFLVNCSLIDTYLKKKQESSKKEQTKDSKNNEKESYDSIEDPYRVLRD